MTKNFRVPRAAGRAGTIAIAVVAALLTWAIGTQLIGVELVVDQGRGPVPVRLPQVAAAPVVSGLAGWGLLALLERLFRTAGRVGWRVIAIGVLVLSLLSPIVLGQSVAVIGWLAALHVVVGVILIIGFSVLSVAVDQHRHTTTAVNTAA